MNIQLTSKQAGFSILESLYALLLSSIVTSGVITGFMTVSKFANDNELRVVSQLKAQSALDMITPDIRMIGNGVPFHQANFLIDQATLTDNTVTQPILVDSTDANQITFRINESGESYILFTDLNPATSSTISLTSVSGILVGDPVYITNATVAEDDGFYGTVTAKNTAAKTITVANKQFHPGSTFPKGSLLEVVNNVTYSTGTDYSNLTRDAGDGGIVLVENAIIDFTYLNSAGTAITLPLVASSANPFPASSIQNVQAVRVKVQVRSERQLAHNGDFYVAEVYRTVGIRNLNYKY